MDFEKLFSGADWRVRIPAGIAAMVAWANALRGDEIDPWALWPAVVASAIWGLGEYQSSFARRIYESDRRLIEEIRAYFDGDALRTLELHDFKGGWYHPHWFDKLCEFDYRRDAEFPFRDRRLARDFRRVRTSLREFLTLKAQYFTDGDPDPEMGMKFGGEVNRVSDAAHAAIVEFLREADGYLDRGRVPSPLS